MSTLLVCSGGGHLSQLHALLPRLQGVGSERVWVTFDTRQSRSLLDGEQIVYLDYAGPRDYKTLARHAVSARRMFTPGHSYSTVVSTGSGLALSFLPIARMRGAACHYIESFTRTAGPSLTGSLLSRTPGISVYSQYRDWAQVPWRYAGSVFDAFVPARLHIGAREIRRAVVTLGTMQDYPFRRLVDRALELLPQDVEVLWQVGCTDVSDLRIAAHRQLPAQALQAAVKDADVVIAHAGCGSSLSALEAGKLPVLVPRRAERGENIDDHQRLLADELARRGLALAREPEELGFDDLLRAACSTVTRCEAHAPFALRQ